MCIINQEAIKLVVLQSIFRGEKELPEFVNPYFDYDIPAEALFCFSILESSVLGTVRLTQMLIWKVQSKLRTSETIACLDAIFHLRWEHHEQSLPAILISNSWNCCLAIVERTYKNVHV